MTCPKAIISVLIFVFCSLQSAAQNGDRYVYKDTSIQPEETLKSVIEAPMEESKAETEYETKPDTTLRINHFIISADSIEALKKLRPFGYARNLDSLLKALQEERKEKTNSASEENSWLYKFFTSGITKVFFWVLAGCFILFILYKLFLTEGFFQRQSAKSKVNLLPQEEDNLSANTDYNSVIAHAISNKNYRLAVRYLYLQSLQKLSAGGLIQFAPNKTNYQYVRELQNKSYKNEFASLTLHYEYAWYGEFEMDEFAFSKIQNSFKQFINQL